MSSGLRDVSFFLVFILINSFPSYWTSFMPTDQASCPYHQHSVQYNAIGVAPHSKHPMKTSGKGLFGESIIDERGSVGKRKIGWDSAKNSSVFFTKCFSGTWQLCRKAHLGCELVSFQGLGRKEPQLVLKMELCKLCLLEEVATSRQLSQRA